MARVGGSHRQGIRSHNPKRIRVPQSQPTSGSVVALALGSGSGTGETKANALVLPYSTPGLPTDADQPSSGDRTPQDWNRGLVRSSWERYLTTIERAQKLDGSCPRGARMPGSVGHAKLLYPKIFCFPGGMVTGARHGPGGHRVPTSRDRDGPTCGTFELCQSCAPGERGVARGAGCLGGGRAHGWWCSC